MLCIAPQVAAIFIQKKAQALTNCLLAPFLYAADLKIKRR
jgi:hypothetical protein